MRAFFLFTFLLAAPAFASLDNQKSNDPLCQVLAHYNDKPKPAIVGANYQAGIDAYGRAVAPADINAAPSIVPDIIKVPLDINLANRMSRLVDGLDLTSTLGMIEIHQDGTVKYNGEDWSGPVKTLCGQSHKIVEEMIVEQVVPIPVVSPQDNGQQSPDTVVSPVELETIKAGEISQSFNSMAGMAIEVKPTEAMPPKEIEQTNNNKANIGQIEVDSPEIEATKIAEPETDIIEGGEYRELSNKKATYNE